MSGRASGSHPGTPHAAALVGVGSTTAQAATEVHINQYVQAHHSGKDLAVLNASTAPGQPIVQFTRNTGPNQQWEITSLPSSPAPGMAPDRQIKNPLSGLCLDVANNSLAAGAAVVQNPCNVNDPAQRWIVPKLAEIFSPDGGFRHYVNKNSGLAIDDPGCHVLDSTQALGFARSRYSEAYIDGQWQYSTYIEWATVYSAVAGR